MKTSTVFDPTQTVESGPLDPPEYESAKCACGELLASKAERQRETCDVCAGVCKHMASRPWGTRGSRECLDCGMIFDADPEDEPEEE